MRGLLSEVLSDYYADVWNCVSLKAWPLARPGSSPLARLGSSVTTQSTESNIVTSSSLERSPGGVLVTSFAKNSTSGTPDKTLLEKQTERAVLYDSQAAYGLARAHAILNDMHRSLDSVSYYSQKALQASTAAVVNPASSRTNHGAGGACGEAEKREACRQLRAQQEMQKINS